MKIGIITGGSSGIGRTFALEIAKRYKGLDEIWLMGRNKDRLEVVAKKLEVPVRLFLYDLSDEESYTNFSEILQKICPQVRLLVNCAGVGKIGRFSEMTIDEQMPMLQINIIALTKMTHLVLPYMPRGSRVIQVASGAAFLPQPGFAVYAASKAYVLSFSRSVGEEVRTKGIYFTALCPGPVDTPFFSLAETGKKRMKWKNYFMTRPERVVNVALGDAQGARTLSVPGVAMKLVLILGKCFPQGLLIRAIGWMQR